MVASINCNCRNERENTIVKHLWNSAISNGIKIKFIDEYLITDNIRAQRVNDILSII